MKEFTKKALILEPLHITNISYLNTKLNMMKLKYPKNYQTDFTKKAVKNNLMEKFESIQQNIEKLKSKGIPETLKSSKLPSIFKENTNLIDAYIQRKLIYDMEIFINEELNFQRQNTSKIENKEPKNTFFDSPQMWKNTEKFFSIINKSLKLSNSNLIVKENETRKNILNFISEKMNDEFLKNCGEFLSGNLNNLEFLQKNYFTFLEGQLEKEFDLDCLNDYIITNYSNTIKFRNTAVYAIIYFLKRTGKIDLLKNFLCTDLVYDFFEMFGDQKLFTKMNETLKINEDLKFENEENKKMLNDEFYEILVEIFLKKRNQESLPALINSFEDFLFVRIAANKIEMLNEELNSLKKSNNSSLFLLGKTLIGKFDEGMELLILSEDVLKIFYALFYNFSRQTKLEKNMSENTKNFIIFVIKLAEMSKKISQNNSEENYQNSILKYKNNETTILSFLLLLKNENLYPFLIKNLIKSTVNFTVLIEKNTKLKQMLIENLELTNKREILIKNKSLIENIETYQEILIADFLNFLINFNLQEKEYIFFDKILSEIEIKTKNTEMLKALKNIYSFFQNPNIKNLKETLLANPKYFNFNDFEYLIDKLVKKSIKFIKTYKDAVLARNVFQLMEFYGLKNYEVSEELVIFV